jgi:hypothetical protein
MLNEYKGVMDDVDAWCTRLQGVAARVEGYNEGYNKSLHRL